MKIATLLGGVAALGLCAATTASFAKDPKYVEEERYQIESTHTETTTHSAPPQVVVQQPAPPPVIVQQQRPAPPPVIVQERTKEVPVPKPVPQAIHEGQDVTLSGRVTGIDGSDVLMDANGQVVRIDTGDMNMNPVKDPNGPRLSAGDQITVQGKVDDIDHERVKVEARSIQVVARNTAPQTVR
jgi:hypothetical protein